MDDKSDTKRVLSRFSRDGLSGWRRRGAWRSCFLLPVLIMMFALPLTAQEEAFPIDEDFEGTTLPEGWSVESVKGERQWELKTEDGNSYMELRNLGEQSLGFESRLISPVIDLSDFMDPVVIFSYRMDKWAGGCDSLVVEYRTSPDADFKPIEKSAIGTYASAWTQDTVYSLPLPGGTYQVAFRGIDRLGRGIQIDNVTVRECPDCMTPAVTMSAVDKTTASFLWTSGGLDAAGYRVRVNTEPMSAFMLADPDYKADVADEIVGSANRFYTLDGLSLGTDYYVYVCTMCGQETSSYSMEVKFTTLNTEPVPYHETFDLQMTGMIQQIQNWYYYNSDEAVNPFINTNLTDVNLANFSPDKSPAMLFGTSTTWGVNAMNAGVVCYAITPELTGKPLAECQVRFSAIPASNQANGGRLIIGTVPSPETDVDDMREVFTPADTVIVVKDEFQEVIVPLTTAQAEDKYVVFLSDFDVKNAIAVDDLYIEEIPACPKAIEVKAGTPSADQITVTWNSMGCMEGEVMITTEKLTDLEEIDESKVVTTVKGNLPITVSEKITPWTEYYVYARNTCGADGNGAWSVPVYVRTPEEMGTLPRSFDFEDESNWYTLPTTAFSSSQMSKGVIVLSLQAASTVRCGGPNVDHLSTSQYCIYAQAKTDEYAVFPELADVENTRVVLWHAGYNENQMFIVGLMPDANDTAFVALDTVISEQRIWNHYSIDLRGHSDKGKYFAIKYPATGTHWIDDIEFKQIPDCPNPTSINITAEAEDAHITWDANGASKWQVRVLGENNYDALYDPEYSGGWLLDETVTSPEADVAGLTAGEEKYYFYIKPVCDGENTDWMTGVEFKTQCADVKELPYTEDFEKYYSMFGYGNQTAIPCYTIYSSMEDPSSYYGSPIVNCGTRSSLLVMQSDSVGTGASARNGYFIFPAMNTDLQGLMLSMDVKGTKSNADGYIEVGVLEDPADTGAFVAVDKVMVEYNQTSNVQIYFSKYEGEGRYIALRTLYKSVCDYEIDNIVINTKAGCPKVKSLTADEITGTTARLNWSGDVETEWELVVSTKALSSDDLSAVMTDGADGETVVFADKVTENPYNLEKGLFYNTYYFFYVRAICAEGVTGAWSDVGNFRTGCGVLSVDEMKVEDFENYVKDAVPACWTSGNSQDPETLPGVTPYTPKISTSQSHSGSNSLSMQTVSHSATKIDRGGYIVSPEIKTDKISRLQISFWGYANRPQTGAEQAQLRVGIVTDVNDAATFVEQEVLDNYSQWYHYTIPFDLYEGDMNGQQGKRVMFLSDFPLKNNFFIDDVKFEEIPSCAAPAHVKLDSLSTDYARIEWSGEAPYIVKISETQLTYEELATLTNDEGKGLVSYEGVKDDFIELEGLEKRTAYFAYIGKECGDTILWSNILSFETTCEDEYPLPYVMDFNDAPFTGNYSGPDCWENFYGEERIWYQKSVISTTGRSGYGLQMQAHDAVYTSYAVMPKLSVPVDSTLVSFYAKISTSQIAQGNIVVGVVTDMTSRETMKNSFHPVDTVFITSDDWTKFYVPMDSYTGSEGNIAFTTLFRYSLNMAGDMVIGDMYIDDVEVDSLPSCMFPEYLKVDSVTPNSITVSFTELGDADQWQIACLQKGETIDGAEAVDADALTHLITGLEPGTDYEIYVRSVCDAAAGDFSPWTGPVMQRTAAQSPVEEKDYPYSETFEGNLSSTWNFSSVDTANVWTSGTALANGEGSKSIYITKDGTSAAYDPTDATAAWAYRTLHLEPGVYTFSYDWISGGDLRVGIIPAEGMFDGGSDEVYYADGSASSLDGFTGIMDGRNSLGGSEDATWQSLSDYIIIENDMAGFYHFVLLWRNSAAAAGNLTSPSAAVDNLKIERSSCVQPLNLYVGRTLSTEADLTWEIVGDKSEYSEWEVYVTADASVSSPDEDTDGSKKIFGATVKDTTYVLIEKLEELSTYYAFVRATCASDGSKTSWSEKLEFTTPCDPIPVGTVYDFEGVEHVEEIGCLAHGYTKYAVNCTPSIYRDCIYPLDIATSTSSSVIAFSGNNAIYTNKSQYGSSDGYYLALPHIEGSLDNVQLTFWMRPIPHRADGTMGVNAIIGSSLDNSASTITVAAMTDLKDTSTLKLIQECVYPYTDEDINTKTNISEDITGHDWWVKFSVPLKGYDGERILLLDERTDREDNYLYIDSVAVEYVPTCKMPTDVSIDRVTDESVTFSFQADGEGTWRYRYSTDPKMSGAVTGDITEPEATIEGLSQHTTYYLSVCRVCGDETSEWTLNKKFTTDYSVRFEQRFSDVTNVPVDWSRANTPSAEVLFDIPESKWYYDDLQVMDGWIYSPLDNNASAHQKIRLTAGTSQPRWLISPSVYLQPEQNAYMTFDAMLTLADSYDALGADVEQTANTFMVLISDDAGKTWLEKNATLWDAVNGTDDLTNFYALTNAFKSVRIDLSQYQGKSIKVAFYVLPNVPVDLDLHIDNVYINSYETKEIPDNVCEECDYVYEPEDIVIPSAEYDMEAAQNVFEVFKVSDDGGSDNLYRFILNVNKMGRSEFYEEICEGNTYDGHGFTGVTSAGTHWRKLAGAGDRCDSVATLHLTVNPLERKEFDATMCAGGKYEWNGNTYTTAGDYTDTVLSVGDGCDTVVTLHLTTIPAMEAERTHYLCEGESLTIDGRTFTSDGSWKEETVEERKAAVEEDGCDSVITHTVIYAQKYDMVIEAAICDGETYNKNGFTAQAERDYHLTETSDLTGCDSLVTLNLLVINPGETEREVTRNITVGQLPYNFYGDEYDENTAPGQYTGEVTVTSESGACSMTVKYTLNVGDIEPGTDNVTEPGELILTPNPVRVHETVMLHLDLTAAERDGLTVSVYGSTGALIERFAPDSEPIVIDGLDAAGVYMVRVTDGLGHVYQGKIIVR